MWSVQRKKKEKRVSAWAGRMEFTIRGVWCGAGRGPEISAGWGYVKLRDVLDVKHRCRTGHRREESGARGKVRAEGVARGRGLLQHHDGAHRHGLGPHPSKCRWRRGTRAEPWALDSCGSTGAQDEAGSKPREARGWGASHIWEPGPAPLQWLGSPVTTFLLLSLWLPCALQGLCVYETPHPHTR